MQKSSEGAFQKSMFSQHKTFEAQKNLMCSWWLLFHHGLLNWTRNKVLVLKTVPQITAAKAKTNKNVYAKDPEAQIIRERTFHLNDEEETEIDQTETVEGKINVPAIISR